MINNLKKTLIIINLAISKSLEEFEKALEMYEKAKEINPEFSMLYSSRNLRTSSIRKSK